MSLNGPVLIVGASGMLAQAVAGALSARQTRFVGVGHADCDITRPVSIATAFDKHQPSTVINCAAFANVDGCEKDPARADAVNGDGVGHLAAVCADRDVTLVHYSTDYVFDGTRRRPLQPGDPVGPRSAYGRSKLRGERRLIQHNPTRYLILRTAWLYGPGGPSFPLAMLNAARAGKPLNVVADQHGSPTYTADLAEASLDLLDAGASGIFHVTSSGQTTWFDFARAIFDEFGLASACLAPIDSAAWKQLKPDAADRPPYSVLDTSDTTALIGRPLPEWRDGLRRYRQATSDAFDAVI